MAFIKRQPDATEYSGERKYARDCAGLALQLSDDKAIARRWAARDLVACPNASGPLVDRLKLETDVSVREVILTALTRIGDDLAVVGLVECLRSEDAALRNEAIDAMKQLPDEVAPLMRGLLDDTDPDVRIFAVNILESLCHPDVESWLIDVIERDAHVNVCATAVDLLGEVGSVASKEALLRLKKRFSDEPFVQFAADIALRRIDAD
jgi:HEAT repeat protein